MLNFLLDISRMFPYNSQNSQKSSDQEYLPRQDTGLVEIQLQKGVDQWRGIATVTDDPIHISTSMMEYSQLYPEYRVRAVSLSNNAILDIF